MPFHKKVGIKVLNHHKRKSSDFGCKTVGIEGLFQILSSALEQKRRDQKLEKRSEKLWGKLAIVGLFQIQNHYYKLLEKHQIRNFKLNS